jgi:predicted ATPase
MITKLKITNFKSHKNTILDFSNLTLLTGVNSSGKSSVIQSLLLLRQSYKKGRLNIGLDLNDPLCDIGKGLNALYQFSDNEIIQFYIEIDNSLTLNFEFNVKDKYDSTFLPSISTNENLTDNFSLFSNDFQYLSAGRWGATDLYPMDSYAIENEKQLSLKNGQGELIAHFLEHYRDLEISEEKSLMLHHLEENKKLLSQVIAWEREISPRLTIEAIKKAERAVLNFGYKGIEENPPIIDLSGKNIGFGISYSLSVITALLSAEPNSLIIIENPEAHLHPHAQSKIAELIALASQCKIQVLIETHSDHILNGILVACKKFEKSKVGIDSKNVKIYFFGERNVNHVSQYENIEILKGGRILNQPNGFFDQTEIDLSTLMGF